MNTAELLKKVRKVEIKTKGLSNHIFAGEYHTAFKGKGMAFSEVREYKIGDDVRTIDWNVTARYNNPFVKVFEEEREMTVILLIDISKSGKFGTEEKTKKEIATELSAILAFSAIQNNDKVGVIFFTDIIEKFIPPKKGKSHILRIIRELLAFKPLNNRTDIGVALEYFSSVIKKRSVCFILSDFIDKDFTRPLQIANKKHDIVAIRIYDKREEFLPNIGLIKIVDAENGSSSWLDSSSKKTRLQFSSNYKKKVDTLQKKLILCGVDHISINTSKSYIKPLINFFKQRERRR
tara:strand:+ start:66387 stop:67262 length:876 start_codon:yes stop_codon:yes gene_type:complete